LCKSLYTLVFLATGGNAEDKLKNVGVKLLLEL
jgi:hypothetical protein